MTNYEITEFIALRECLIEKLSVMRQDDTLGLLHKTLTGEKTQVKSENSGKQNVTIDFTIGKKLWLK